MVTNTSSLTALAQAGQPTEFWITLSTNALILIVGGVLTAISYVAYQRERDRSFRIAALGFGLLTTGSLVIVIYQVGVNRSFLLGGIELLRVQTLSGTLVLIGLLLLLYSLYRY